jgi:hypothetical protein
METRTSYEESEIEEEFTKEIAKQHNGRSKMSTKPMKPIETPSIPRVKSSTVNKQKMVDAIVGLEHQMGHMIQKFDVLDDAFRQFIEFKDESSKFQEFLDKTTKKREKLLKKNESDKKPK